MSAHVFCYDTAVNLGVQPFRQLHQDFDVNIILCPTENIDPALLRPGRFGKQIYIGLPDVEGRLDILQKLTQV